MLLSTRLFQEASFESVVPKYAEVNHPCSQLKDDGRYDSEIRRHMVIAKYVNLKLNKVLINKKRLLET